MSIDVHRNVIITICDTIRQSYLSFWIFIKNLLKHAKINICVELSTNFFDFDKKGGTENYKYF